ncbi:cytochrome P450 [Gautieria morchelliformis]|nr:cytochrome P450 [Gautieria morchelliformis]
MPVVTPQPATARHILLLIVGALLVTIIRYATRPDPLRNIPGPWLARWTSILLAYHARTGKRHLYVDALHKRYGPFVRITPTQVSCATPSAPSKIYSHGSSSLPKSAFYRAFYVPSSRTFFDPGTPNLFSTQDRGGHARKRRVLAHALSASVVKGYEGWVRSVIANIATTDNHSSTTPFIDILAWLNYMTLDVISSLAFGRALGLLEGEGQLNEMDGADLDENLARDLQPEKSHALATWHAILHPLLHRYAKWVPDEFVRRGVSGSEVRMKRAKKGEAAGLKAREREKDGGDATMAEFWEGGESEDGEGITEEDVVTEAMLLLTAGSDTTANSAAAVLFHLLRVPRVLACLREELEEAVGPVADELIQSLKYLQATIDEGLRMFATNAFGLPRVVPPGGRVCIGEMNFGEGTELSAPAYTMQHDPAIWGDPEVFRPERWLEGGAELKKYLFTFGMGPRACIGQNLAIMQVKLLLATLVLRYDMELRDEVMDSVEGFMHKPVAVWMRLKRRRGQGSRIVHD